MTVVHHAAAYSDVGLEWGRMWLLRLVSPDMQYRDLHRAASVRLVITARRRAGGSRDRGYWHHIFIRRPDRDYAEFEYEEILDDTAMPRHGPNIFGQVGRLFLTELEAWQAYADWLQWYIDQHRAKLETAELMLTETEGIMRLKAGRP